MSKGERCAPGVQSVSGCEDEYQAADGQKTVHGERTCDDGFDARQEENSQAGHGLSRNPDAKHEASGRGPAQGTHGPIPDFIDEQAL